MKRLYYSALTYTMAGLAAGLYYRDLTEFKEFEGSTQLSVVHTHLLVLGTLFFLVIMVLEKVFAISETRSFKWFYWTYHSGVALTVGMLLVHGTLTVFGKESNAAIAGIAGLGHIFLTAAFILLFVALKGKVLTSVEDATPTAAHPV